MCRLAVANDPFFDVDDIETRRAGPSYTLDTVREFRRTGQTDIAWLIGADMAISLPRWHEPAKLMAEVNFVLMARPGWSMNWSTLPIEFRHLAKNVVQAPALEISSTALRERLENGKSIRYLTSDAVIEYIRNHKVYL